jgi:hypothetical protein
MSAGAASDKMNGTCFKTAPCAAFCNAEKLKNRSRKRFRGSA